MQFHLLSDDTCRLLATWCIAQLDKNGVFYGEPVMVKSFVFPRRDDISIDQVACYLEEMQTVGLIVLFEAKGQRWQWWPGFYDNQVGLRADREKTDWPAPPNGTEPVEDEKDNPDDYPNNSADMPEDSRKDAGKKPAEMKLNESEIESKDSPKGVKRQPPSDSEFKNMADKKKAQAMFSALTSVCKIDLGLISDKDRGKFNQAEKKMRDNGLTPQKIYDFEKWWLDNDWRGQRGQPPTLNNIRETWGQFKAGIISKNGAKNATYQQQPEPKESSFDRAELERELAELEARQGRGP